MGSVRNMLYSNLSEYRFKPYQNGLFKNRDVILMYLKKHADV